MHANFIRPGKLAFDIPENFLVDIEIFLRKFKWKINEFEELLTNSRIWKQRLLGVGVITAKKALDFGFSGVMLRSTGILWDLRIINNYDNYCNFDFFVPVSKFGDSYDRYLLRIEEMKQSVVIIEQVLCKLNFNLFDNYQKNINKILPPSRANLKFNMEEMIQHFKFFSEGFVLPKSEVYSSVEAPKGEFGVFLVTERDTKPYRLKIKAPGFLHLQGLNYMVRNHMIADLVTVIGTQDIVFGEVDR